MAETVPALERLINKLTKENLWLYILRLLQERPMYGYEIRKEIKERFGFNPAVVTAYVVHYKMQVEGLVTTKWEKSSRGRPDRKYYEITPEGEELMKKAKRFLKDLLEKIFDKTEM